MKKFTVDRIEEGFAVCECEDLSHISVPVESFPFEIKEGMMIRLLSDGTYERAEDEAVLYSAYKKCSKTWSDKKILVYKETLKGKSKKEIARELGMTYQGTKNILDKILKDLKKEIEGAIA